MKKILLLFVLINTNAMAQKKQKAQISFLNLSSKAPSDLNQERPADCKVIFRVGELKNTKYEVIGEFNIPKNAYGDGSSQAWLQIDDLIKKLKPMACKENGDTVILKFSPQKKGVRKAILIKTEPKKVKGNS